MEIYVPKLKKLNPTSVGVTQFQKRHYMYQRTLRDTLKLLQLGVDLTDSRKMNSDIASHVEFIVKQFHLTNSSNFTKYASQVWTWHADAQMYGDLEIVDIDGIFYQRTWAKQKLKNKLDTLGLLFWLDYSATAKVSNALTLMIGQNAYFNKSAQSLRRRIQMDSKPYYGRVGVLKKHKQQGSFVESEHLDNLRNLNEVRTDLLYKHGIKAALEIVELTSNILLLEPRSMGLSTHMLERNGMAFVFDFLRYIAACTNVNVFEHAIDLAMHKAVDDPMAAPKHIFQYLKNENPFSNKTIQALMKRTELDPNYT